MAKSSTKLKGKHKINDAQVSKITGEVEKQLQVIETNIKYLETAVNEMKTNVWHGGKRAQGWYTSMLGDGSGKKPGTAGAGNIPNSKDVLARVRATNNIYAAKTKSVASNW